MLIKFDLLLNRSWTFLMDAGDDTLLRVTKSIS